ncbi:MAG: HAMP domain-containing sensor histidine kinase, partial [Myxococcota bacterium]
AADMWQTSGREQVEDYIDRQNQLRAAVTMHLVPNARADRSGQAALSARQLITMSAERRIAAVIKRADKLVAQVRINADTILELRQSLDSYKRFYHEVTRQQVGFTAILSLVCAGALVTLGLILIGRPTRQLVEQARTIASGDYSSRASVRQRDEIGTLAREMNRMSERLGEAQELVRNERRARTATLEQLRHADRLSTVGKIASGLAHELGTPLNVISGRAQLIASTADDADADRIRADAGIIVEQASVMTSIIRQLLDYSRRRALQRAHVDLGDLVDRACALIEPIAEARGVEVQTGVGSADSAKIGAEIDAGKVLQVITNLMVNGIQAMPDGGPLRVTYDDEFVEEPPDPHAVRGSYIRIDVIDRGIGISPDQQDRIFEPFFTTKDSGEGTGLGLPVSHGIVREHGGWIAVDSSPGRGSTFSIFLPKEPQR